MKVNREPSVLLEDHLIVKHISGSRAYGTSTTTSDTDYRGIFCADPVNIRTPWFPIYEIENKNDGNDTVYYELSKYLKLLVDQNPNIVETLWVDTTDIIYFNDIYTRLRVKRQELLSSKLAFTFSGYAIAQLKRIKGHNKWINNPQTIEPPAQIDFVSLIQWFGGVKVQKLYLSDFRDNYRLIPYGKDIYGLVPFVGYQTFADDLTLNTLFEEPHHTAPKPLAILKFNKEEYNIAKDTWHNYWTWKNNRNEKRSVLEEEHGYDTKHAMHLVRLLRMGHEALSTGEVLVKRPDAEELLQIRNGSWTYDKLVEYAEHMDNDIKNLYKTTSLQKLVDIHYVARLLITLQDMVWN